MDRLLNFLKVIIDKLAVENIYVSGAPGEKSSPQKEIWEGLLKDYEGGEGEEAEVGTIGELRQLLRDIKSQHVFIKK